ncbi:hypothetical protein SAMN05421823_104131 [Catalinimonas alkaloidigena]|uniref:Radical SAM core domain-containing protein n=1 Tax=Catalinimonas alkaloidigena TaxID=1075417 RepID=A0A1G9GJS0_9BACT|nr:radical SAM protein [Catalinimonas alkaloidigena]SDL00842.1 hypothetical protein SAMN05421823_104131 [Catalinimonas alkaloidigena]
MAVKPYTYFDFTLSLCPTCLRRVDAKIVIQDGKVFLRKTCADHGYFNVLIASDAEYYRKQRLYNKPSESGLRHNTEVHYGCPYDCGLCADHEQHSCLTLLEVTDRCNLTCPTCYAESSPTFGRHRTLAEIEAMLDAIVANEGEPDVVQISGGEPTIHPQFWEIMDLVKTKPIRHVMLNTNGVRIARDFAFAERLATYTPKFEIYLQFDSFRPEVLRTLRGKDLLDVRMKALEHLNRLNLSTTLVVTLRKGLNDDEIGAIVDFALKQKCVRGVTLQPTQYAGRVEDSDPTVDRLTLTEVRQQLIDQTGLFTPNDVVPVPCNPDALAMAYALKLDDQVFPLTRYVDPQLLLESGRNTIVYEQDPELHARVLRIFSTGSPVDGLADDFESLLCCLPLVQAPGLSYSNLFRVIIMQFMDAWDFDVRAIKKSCVHIAHPDGRIIPFETMNLFYRNDRAQVLATSRQPVMRV